MRWKTLSFQKNLWISIRFVFHYFSLNIISFLRRENTITEIAYITTTNKIRYKIEKSYSDTISALPKNQTTDGSLILATKRVGTLQKALISTPF
jgi:hypothetical protein